MAALPVVTVRAPTDLAGLLNGNLPADMLVTIGPRGQLHRSAARAWRALHAAAAADGIDLTYTYGGTYRSLAEQSELFTQRYTTTPQPGQPTKTWRLTTYWQKPHTAMAAVPGTSNHGLGLAIDTALGTGPDSATSIMPALAWLLEHAPAYGFSWETQSEPWHIRLVTGDLPTVAVLAHEAPAGVTTTPSRSDLVVLVEAQPPEADDMSIKILRSLSDPPEFYAQFIAYTDADGHSIEVQWSGPGDDPKSAQRMRDLRAAGIVEEHVTLAGLRNNVLHPRHQPSEILDALHTWSAADFA